MKQSDNKTLTFFRKNAPYLVLALCVLAIGLSTTLILLKEFNMHKKSGGDKWCHPFSLISTSSIYSLKPQQIKSIESGV